MSSIFYSESSLQTISGSLPAVTIPESSFVFIPNYTDLEIPSAQMVLRVRSQNKGAQIDCLTHESETGLVKLCQEQPELARKLNIAVLHIKDGYYVTTCPNAERFNFLSEMMIIDGDSQAPFFQLLEVYGGIEAKEAFDILWAQALPQSVPDTVEGEIFCLHDIHIHLAGMLKLPKDVALAIHAKALDLEAITDRNVESEKALLALAVDVLTAAVASPVKDLSHGQVSIVIEMIENLGLSEAQALRMELLCLGE